MQIKLVVVVVQVTLGFEIGLQFEMAGI